MIRIKELRNKKNISGPKLGEMLNVSTTYIYDIEKGRRRVHGEMLSDIADILDTSTDYLLGRTDDPTPPGKKRKQPDFEAMVLSEKTAADAVTRSMDIYEEYNLPREWMHQMWDKISLAYTLGDKNSPKTLAKTPDPPNTDDFIYEGIENKTADMEFICSLLEKGLIVLTDDQRKPLSIELKRDFISYLKNHTHPEINEEVVNHNNAALAAHMEGKPRGLDPKLLAFMSIADKLNKILRKYLQTRNKERKIKKR